MCLAENSCFVRCCVQPLTYIFRIHQIKILCKSKCNFHFRLTLFRRCCFYCCYCCCLLFSCSLSIFFSSLFFVAAFDCSLSLACGQCTTVLKFNRIGYSFYASIRPNLLLVVAFFDSISLYYIYILVAHG